MKFKSVPETGTYQVVIPEFPKSNSAKVAPVFNAALVVWHNKNGYACVETECGAIIASAGNKELIGRKKTEKLARRLLKQVQEFHAATKKIHK